MATRRPLNPSRRVSETGKAPFPSALQSRSGSPSYLSIALIILGALVVVGYLFRGQGTFGSYEAFSQVEGDFPCTIEAEHTIPILKKAYGDSFHKVLHVGPSTCSVVSRLMKEEDTEAWGMEPYDIEDAGPACHRLVHRGLARVADIKFPLPYRPKSFSSVIVSDALDYLSPKYLNRTLPELARVSADGLVIFTGYPHHHKIKVVDKAKYGRSASHLPIKDFLSSVVNFFFGTPAKLRSSVWWIRYFVQMGLEENEAVIKKFEQAAAKSSYTPRCQIFHLKPYQ